MEYFVMVQDGRSAFNRVDFRADGFGGREPFVTYLELPEEEKLPDFLWGRGFDRSVFCVSDRMKDILDNYAAYTQETPVFLTDTKYRCQRVYWLIGVTRQNCLNQDFYAGIEHLSFCLSPEAGVSVFQAVNIHKDYLIVSLELAENLLRRRMYGLQFYPVGQGNERG